MVFRIRALSVPIFLAGAAVLPLGAGSYVSGRQAEKPVLPDTSGRPVPLLDSAKKATAVFFLSTECPITNRYTPRIQRLWKAYGARGVRFVAVYPNTRENDEVVRSSARARGYTFPVLRDPGGRIARKWGVTVTPEAVVLNRQGQVVYRGAIDDDPDVGRVRHRLVAEALGDVLAGRRVRAASNKPLGCLIEASAPVKAVSVTYAGHVQLILRANCEPCHHTGGSAPFSLTAFQQAKSWAPMIRRVTARRIMPPWKPAPDFGHFRGERRLTDEQVQTLARWADAGAPLGDARKVLPAQTWPQGWKLGTPDMVLQPDRPYHLAAEGPDVYRCYSFPAPEGEVHWLSGAEVRLDNRAVVHHVLIFLDPTGKSAALDGKEPDPGYTSTGGGINIDDAEVLSGWAPGIEPDLLPSGTAFPVPPGSRLVVQVHYHKNGLPETDRTSVALHWARGPVDKAMRMIPILNPGMRLPAGQRNIPIHAEMDLKDDAHAYTVIPHMHLLGRLMQAVATRPDGKKIPLIRIPDWDFNWQAIYELQEPVALPAGTHIDVDAVFDNSAGNPRNPNHPPKDVTWGEQTTDEMCLFFLGITLDREHNLSQQVAAVSRSAPE